MYNVLKDKLYSSIHFSFVKNNYSLVYEKADTEEIYYNEEKCRLFVVVKDQEIGKRIYNIKSNFKSGKNYIKTENYNVKVIDFCIDKKKSVQWFELEIYSMIPLKWNNYNQFEKLEELYSFYCYMKALGYILDDELFDVERCSSLSEFLSYFTFQNDREDKSNELFIKYIHYVLSDGGKLEEDYKKIESKGLIHSSTEFPYTQPIVQMCYNYYKFGKACDNIKAVLDEADVTFMEKYLLLFEIDGNQTNYKVTKRTEEYIIYNDEIKIYQDISDRFKVFLNHNDFLSNKKFSLEQIKNIIRDVKDGSIIGYTFQNKTDYEEISEWIPSNQKEIFDCISEMVFLPSWYFSENIQKKDVEFDVKKSMVLSESNVMVRTLKDLFDLLSSDLNQYYQKVTALFFEIMNKYIIRIYGKCSKKEMLAKNEIKVINPLLAHEFLKYVFYEEVYYSLSATECLKEFCMNKKESLKYYYDNCFLYNPGAVEFLFDFEINRNCYSYKGETIELPDHRTAKIFKKSTDVEKFYKVNQKKKAEIRKIFQKLDGRDIKILEPSQLIFSSKLNNNNMYNLIGYVTNPVQDGGGKFLTGEYLSSLSNKDLYIIIGKLLTKFTMYYIPLKFIQMDDSFNFYIDYLKSDFRVEKMHPLNQDFNQILKESIKNDLPFIDTNYYCSDESYWIDLSKSCNKYCDEHKIYYRNNRGVCPACELTKYFVKAQEIEVNYEKVFEDKYATHYILNDEYNIKVYKDISTDLQKKIHHNLKYLVEERVLNEHSIDCFQDLFIPEKIAVNHENEIIGYIYKKVNFEKVDGSNDVCIDISDLSKLNNLARLKSLYRLSIQLDKIYDNGYSFIDNPLTAVFLNPAHTKQVQILNIEFLQGFSVSFCIWKYDYIKSILYSDKTLSDVKIGRNPTPLEISTTLDTAIKNMKNHCLVHGRYYSDKYIFCPDCMPPEKQDDIGKISKHKKDWDNENVFGDGGEANIYDFCYPTDVSALNVVKIFKEDSMDEQKKVVFTKLLQKTDELKKLNKAQSSSHYYYVTIKDLVIDPDNKGIIGYVMEKIDNSNPILILRDKKEVERLKLTFTDVLKIIIRIGEGIEQLHKLGIFIGDLNGRNILFNRDTGNVYFIDLDGMGIDDISPEYCTDEYIDPISKMNKCITMKDDWYSYAIQVFHYLTYTHPFNGKYQENGKDLNIVEKMEKRLSLLGDHGIEPPTVANSWEWMSPELKKAFLDIFENESRESLVPYLKKELETLSSDLTGISYYDLVRINPKFMAKASQDYFYQKANIIKMINEIACIYKDSDGDNVLCISANGHDFRRLKTKYTNISDVILSNDKEIAFVFGDDSSLHVVDLVSDYITDLSDLSENCIKTAICDRKIYFLEKNEGDYGVQIYELKDEILKGKFIIIFSKNRVLDFSVEADKKFVYVVRDSKKEDIVYCNTNQICSLEYNNKKTRYKIINDKENHMWLVVNSDGYAVAIKSDGTYDKLCFSQLSDKMNINSIVLRNNRVYIPMVEELHIIDINNQDATKIMECRKIMSPNSKLLRFNKKGFSVIYNNKIFDIREG